jgi:hypothetical protein
MSNATSEADLIRVVLADANVLYSRVLRDYLLYAADQEIIAITWSSQTLAEVTEHLIENVEGFDHAAAQRLISAMNGAFPYAEIEPDEEHWRMLDEVSLPDEDDRHVMAASLAAVGIEVQQCGGDRGFDGVGVEPVDVAAGAGAVPALAGITPRAGWSPTEIDPSQ